MWLDRLTQVPGVAKEQSQGGRCQGLDNLHNKHKDKDHLSMCSKVTIFYQMFTTSILDTGEFKLGLTKQALQ